MLKPRLNWTILVLLLGFVLGGAFFSLKFSSTEPMATVGQSANDQPKETGDHEKPKIIKAKDRLEAVASWIFNDATGVATICIVFFTAALWISTAQASEHFRSSERAYVTISHKPPGLRLAEGVDEKGRTQVEVLLKIKNSGRTPAQVNHVFLNYVCTERGATLPTPPDYSSGQNIPMNAFLVTKASVFQGHTHRFIVDRAKIESGEYNLWLYGYVDYTDAFGAKYRGGYARVYQPALPNNLVFGQSPAHNFDRPLDT